ncbi:hypothetical protein LshimejAT787_0408920 [Lyophyllum shimeji]|uniref:Zn(2)-C6 fungal-type domain-containing protein n=1 Tax=Lyophyllum shimeji TaxID=47721 RepID=A0A9P3UP15_LYOSH|nr:hypothetical protein LshimejAT787_0408920 [Lyophyllum shimeji]
MDFGQKVAETGKEKKTRRRLRLSCVECTKRRQKCDRKYPCSLCVSRGVSHLCRWETVPVARPAPARPPNVPSLPTSEQTIQQLLSRIASLEKALKARSNQRSQGQANVEPNPDASFLHSPSGSSTLASTDDPSPCTTPGPDIRPTTSPSTKACGEEAVRLQPRYPDYLQPMAYATTSALAHLALGHHGEYVGRGSVVCALHAISTGTTARFLYAKSTDSTSVYRERNPGLLSTSLIERVEEVIRNIPSRPITTDLLAAFFTQMNWRFGIPEKWFTTACAQMWSVLEYPGPHGMQINANWLCLLFAVLASAPTSATRAPDNADDSDYADRYFSYAMTALRIAENDYMNKPNLCLMVSAADGTVLSCLAVPLLCSYLSQRGRVSEAWKLVGNGLRNAEAVGMHRDPDWWQWQVMSKDEALLRRRAWWGLYVWDKFYSILLGRPQMVRKEIFDVALPFPTDAEGVQNHFEYGQILLIQLAALAGEALETCFSVSLPDFPPFFHIDSRLEHWEECLPSEYQLPRHDRGRSDPSAAELSTIEHQRYVLHTWYLLCRMKVNLAALTACVYEPRPRADVLQCRETCILMAMRIIKLQCDAHAYVQQRAEHGNHELYPGGVWFFEGCFSLFEAAVVLVSTLMRFPWEEKTTEADELLNRALGVLTHVAGQESGKRNEISRMGAEVLASLRQESWWTAQVSGTPAPVANHHPPILHSAGLSAPCHIVQPVDVGYDWFASLTYTSLFGIPLKLNLANSHVAPPFDGITTDGDGTRRDREDP